MRTTLRHALLTVLIALIASLSAAQGLMRGPAEFGQNTLVICTGQGAETITLDGFGEPVSASPDCPDTSVLAVSHRAVGIDPDVRRLITLGPTRLSPIHLVHSQLDAHGARAPPLRSS